MLKTGLKNVTELKSKMWQNNFLQKNSKIGNFFQKKKEKKNMNVLTENSLQFLVFHILAKFHTQKGGGKKN
jgi:hypothetical protein